MGQPQDSPRYRVVVAEDNQLIRELLGQQLRELGHDLAGDTANGIEVVELVAREHPDVALIDRGLPLQDGLAAARSIAVRAPTAVVMLSAYVSNGDPAAEAHAAGAHVFLAKPFSLEDLDMALQQAVRRFVEAR